MTDLPMRFMMSAFYASATDEVTLLAHIKKEKGPKAV
jgi:hypothetical protein